MPFFTVPFSRHYLKRKIIDQDNLTKTRIKVVHVYKVVEVFIMLSFLERLIRNRF